MYSFAIKYLRNVYKFNSNCLESMQYKEEQKGTPGFGLNKKPKKIETRVDESPFRYDDNRKSRDNELPTLSSSTIIVPKNRRASISPNSGRLSFDLTKSGERDFKLAATNMTNKEFLSLHTVKNCSKSCMDHASKEGYHSHLPSLSYQLRGEGLLENLVTIALFRKVVNSDIRVKLREIGKVEDEYKPSDTLNYPSCTIAAYTMTKPFVDGCYSQVHLNLQLKLLSLYNSQVTLYPMKKDQITSDTTLIGSCINLNLLVAVMLEFALPSPVHQEKACRETQVINDSAEMLFRVIDRMIKLDTLLQPNSRKLILLYLDIHSISDNLVFVGFNAKDFCQAANITRDVRMDRMGVIINMKSGEIYHLSPSHNGGIYFDKSVADQIFPLAEKLGRHVNFLPEKVDDLECIPVDKELQDVTNGLLNCLSSLQTAVNTMMRHLSSGMLAFNHPSQNIAFIYPVDVERGTFMIGFYLPDDNNSEVWQGIEIEYYKNYLLTSKFTTSGSCFSKELQCKACPVDCPDQVLTRACLLQFYESSSNTVYLTKLDRLDGKSKEPTTTCTDVLLIQYKPHSGLVEDVSTISCSEDSTSLDLSGINCTYDVSTDHYDINYEI